MITAPPNFDIIDCPMCRRRATYLRIGLQYECRYCRGRISTQRFMQCRAPQKTAPAISMSHCLVCDSILQWTNDGAAKFCRRCENARIAKLATPCLKPQPQGSLVYHCDLRTASDQELKADLDYSRSQWQTIRSRNHRAAKCNFAQIIKHEYGNSGH